MDKQVFTAAGADMGAGTVSGEGLRAWIKEAHERKNRSYPKGSSAVLIPFLIRDGAYHVLYEVRSAKLRSQPGEICFPGGRIEAGESPVETAVREATEELCIDRSRIEIVGALDDTIGPGAIPLFTYIAILHDYEGTWSHAEVDRVFTVPLEWILTHDPDIYRIRLARQMPEDFPYEYVPGGTSCRDAGQRARTDSLGRYSTGELRAVGASSRRQRKLFLTVCSLKFYFCVAIYINVLYNRIRFIYLRARRQIDLHGSLTPLF